LGCTVGGDDVAGRDDNDPRSGLAEGASAQGCFLPTTIVALITYAVIGLWGPAVTHYFLLSLPGALVAVLAGRLLNHRLRGDSFFRIIYAGLIVISAIVMLQALRS
jgi:hypothetical protein